MCVCFFSDDEQLDFVARCFYSFYDLAVLLKFHVHAVYLRAEQKKTCGRRSVAAFRNIRSLIDICFVRTSVFAAPYGYCDAKAVTAEKISL